MRFSVRCSDYFDLIIDQNKLGNIHLFFERLLQSSRDSKASNGRFRQYQTYGCIRRNTKGCSGECLNHHEGDHCGRGTYRGGHSSTLTNDACVAEPSAFTSMLSVGHCVTVVAKGARD